MAGARLIVAVPLYRSPELIAPLFAALGAMADEIDGLGGRVVLVDDSPGDEALASTLADALPALAARVPVTLLANEANLGFVRTANRAMAMARDEGADVILLNSDARPVPGAFAEMAAVAALDPMTAVVSPRSDNATICNSPFIDALRPTPEAALAAHRAIERHLPRVTYVPTAVGFCLLIRNTMLREFGLFDEAFGVGYNEENDFIRRCNRRGYRAVLANHAYCHHLGGVAMGAAAVARDARDGETRPLLDARYPEYERTVHRYVHGVDFLAQRALCGLVPAPDGRVRLLFDARKVAPFFAGTFEHARALIAAFAAGHGERFAIDILCSAEAAAFHALGAIAGVRLVHSEAEAVASPYAIAFRIDQPFQLTDLTTLKWFAAITGCLVLDTIAMDCQQLDDADLESVWQAMTELCTLIGFNSDFTRDQFARRFSIPAHMVPFVSRCSTDVRDYRRGTPAAGRHVLVVGNHYPHKHVRETVEAIRAADAAVPIRVLGLEVNDVPGAAGIAAGGIPQDEVDRLYDEAGVVVFPSHYEGFGLPIMHALARGKPVVARDTPPAREIASRAAGGDNVHLFDDTAAIAAAAIAPPRWRDGADRAGEDWTAAAHALAAAFERALADFDWPTLRRQHVHCHAYDRRLHAQNDAAAAAGRLAEVEARLHASEAHAAHETARADTAIAERDAERDRAAAIANLPPPRRRGLRNLFRR